MGTKKGLVHEMRAPRIFGAVTAAPLHTLAQLPGVEPHATLVASPGSCCASTSADLRSEPIDITLQSYAQNLTQSFSTRPYGLMEVSVISYLAFFAFAPFFDRRPAPK